jgi:hypothetical protein
MQAGATRNASPLNEYRYRPGRKTTVCRDYSQKPVVTGRSLLPGKAASLATISLLLRRTSLAKHHLEAGLPLTLRL